VARVLEDLEPVFLPDVSQEMFKHPDLAPFAPESVGRPTYVFPVSTFQQRYGILVVTKDRGQEFVTEDVELLLSPRMSRSRSSALSQGTAQSCTSDKS
jgi:hypothetical protein